MAADRRFETQFKNRKNIQKCVFKNFDFPNFNLPTITMKRGGKYELCWEILAAEGIIKVDAFADKQLGFR